MASLISGNDFRYLSITQREAAANDTSNRANTIRRNTGVPQMDIAGQMIRAPQPPVNLTLPDPPGHIEGNADYSCQAQEKFTQEGQCQSQSTNSNTSEKTANLHSLSTYHYSWNFPSLNYQTEYSSFPCISSTVSPDVMPGPSGGIRGYGTDHVIHSYNPGTQWPNAAAIMTDGYTHEGKVTSENDEGSSSLLTSTACRTDHLPLTSSLRAPSSSSFSHSSRHTEFQKQYSRNSPKMENTSRRTAIDTRTMWMKEEDFTLDKETYFLPQPSQSYSLHYSYRPHPNHQYPTQEPIEKRHLSEGFPSAYIEDAAKLLNDSRNAQFSENDESRYNHTVPNSSINSESRLRLNRSKMASYGGFLPSSSAMHPQVSVSPSSCERSLSSSLSSHLSSASATTQIPVDVLLLHGPHLAALGFLEEGVTGLPSCMPEEVDGAIMMVESEGDEMKRHEILDPNIGNGNPEHSIVPNIGNGNPEHSIVPNIGNRNPEHSIVPNIWNRNPEHSIVPNIWNRNPEHSIVPNIWNRNPEHLTPLHPSYPHMFTPPSVSTTALLVNPYYYTASSLRNSRPYFPMVLGDPAQMSRGGMYSPAGAVPSLPRMIRFSESPHNQYICVPNHLAYVGAVNAEVAEISRARGNDKTPPPLMPAPGEMGQVEVETRPLIPCTVVGGQHGRETQWAPPKGVDKYAQHTNVQTQGCLNDGTRGNFGNCEGLQGALSFIQNPEMRRVNEDHLAITTMATPQGDVYPHYNSTYVPSIFPYASGLFPWLGRPSSDHSPQSCGEQCIAPVIRRGHKKNLAACCCTVVDDLND